MEIDITQCVQHLEQQSPEYILKWVWETFSPQVAMTSSFQTQSVPLLHMVSRVTPQMPIYFLDTGFHFPETLAFRDRLVADLGLNLKIIKPELGQEGFILRYGQLYDSDPDLCCQINKILPFRTATRDLLAWVSGIRQDQTSLRNTTPIVSLQNNGLYKVCPLANWSTRQIWQYSYYHHLPDHPLYTQGYESIGCVPCTRPIFEGEDPRAGRWAGHNKTECGLHFTYDSQEN